MLADVKFAKFFNLTFLFLQKKDVEEGRFTEGCLTLLTLLILLTYAFGNVSISRPGDQVG